MLKILVLGDWHIGHHRSLMLPEYDDPTSGMKIIANPMQNFLFDKMCHMIKLVGDVDIIIFNGDMIEGPNKHENGHGVWNTDIHAQAQCAATLIDMFRCKKMYFSQGSTYHTGNPTGDKIVCDLVGGTWVGDWQFFEINNALKFYLKHYGDYSSVPYSRCTGQRKQAMIAKSQGTDIDVYINSHTHHFVFSGDSNDLSIAVPCWKGIDSYMGKKSIEKPDNGYVVINVDDSTYTWDYNLFSIPFQLYDKTIKITEADIKKIVSI